MVRLRQKPTFQFKRKSRAIGIRPHSRPDPCALLCSKASGAMAKRSRRSTPCFQFKRKSRAIGIRPHSQPDPCALLCSKASGAMAKRSRRCIFPIYPPRAHARVCNGGNRKTVPSRPPPRNLLKLLRRTRSQAKPVLGWTFAISLTFTPESALEP
jgi:hypothetical protein